MEPGVYNMTLYQGDDRTLIFRLRSQNVDGTPGAYLDLTGQTAKAQIRTTESSSTVAAEFSTEILDQTTTPGAVALTLTGTQTAALASQNYVWDVQLTNASSQVQTYLRGTVLVVAQVTRT